MTEWRRTLKSWPKETAAAADPASLPEWVREAAEERAGDNEAKKRRRRSVFFLGFVGIPFVLLVDLLPSSDPRTWGLIAVGLASVPLALLSAKRSWERGEARRRQRETDRLEVIGESTLGGDFIGVNYADGLWSYPGLGMSVDYGILRFDLDRLSFVGRHTHFDLHPEAILSIEIRRYEWGTGARPRLVIQWAQGGEAGTVGLELPYRRSPRRFVSEAVDLRDRIERWRVDPFPHRAAPLRLPMSMEVIRKSRTREAIGGTAKAIAGLLVFGTAFVTLIGLEVGLALAGHREIGGRLGGAFSSLAFGWFLLWFAVAAKIETRLPERYRYREKEERDVRDVIRTAGAAQTGEPLVDARLEQ